MIKRMLLWTLVLCLGTVSTFAQTPFSGSMLLPAAPVDFIGPGDIENYTAYLGVMPYSHAVAVAGTQKIAILRNTVDNSTCEVRVTSTGLPSTMSNCSTGGDNGTTYNAFCRRGGAVDRPCAIPTLYDQTNGNNCGGASCDFVQATAGNQPLWVYSATECVTRPCISTDVTPAFAAATNFTPSTGILSFSVLGKRTGAAATEKMLQSVGSGNTLQSKLGDSTRWTLLGNGSGFDFLASLNVVHAVNAVINGASSVVNIDGVETTGTATGSTVAAKPSIASSGFSTDTWYGIGFIDNVVLSSGQRSSLRGLMHNWCSC